MEQHATELYQWIEAGANVYVCGSKDPMSVDVENTLIKIIAAHKNIPAEAATAFLANMKEEGRYHKDVY